MPARTRFPGAAAVAITLLLSGCGGAAGDDAEQRTVPAMRLVLREYQPRFEQRRAALRAVVARVPAAGPAASSCDRQPDPKPEFSGYDSESLAQYTYNSPDKGGNTDAMQLSEATAPESAADRATRSTAAPEPGWLARGLWITGAQGPLGTGRFPMTSRYGYQPYDGAEENPVVRLRKILDVGLHRRYVVLYRITRYDSPDLVKRRLWRTVTADAFLADLTERDLPCRFVATGHSYDLITGQLKRLSQDPYEDMQTTLQLDIDDKLRTLTGS